MTDKIIKAIHDLGGKVVPTIVDPKDGKTILQEFTLDKELEETYLQVYNTLAHGPKGVLLAGKIGCGKNTCMTIMQMLFSATRASFGCVETRSVVRAFLRQSQNQAAGMEVLDQYGAKSFRSLPGGALDHTRPIHRCFHDLGLEEITSSLYKNQTSVMSEILADRYDMMLAHGMRTHATTNLGVDSLEASYGNRLRDRFTQMFEMIVMPGGSRRK